MMSSGWAGGLASVASDSGGSGRNAYGVAYLASGKRGIKGKSRKSQGQSGKVIQKNGKTKRPSGDIISHQET